MCLSRFDSPVQSPSSFIPIQDAYGYLHKTSIQFISIKCCAVNTKFPDGYNITLF